MNRVRRQTRATRERQAQEGLHTLLDQEFAWAETFTEGEDDLLLDLPGADSLGLLRVISRAQKEFSVTFDDDELFDLRTVGDLRALVAGKLRSGP
ncbi:acyl carrier protein [Streptomyces yaizuensis]|uniref:Acyl carrier protein n=1 Tax=Streptomyces yaizuensis TaxID=2989713 RepID=A0ABQ5NXN6_9ACTN|nr:acyl carrier protein [Streptomyces sp. YSPA8]GLF95126.1 acyl carrier protein [Streptomyces sp. YSPA8]